MPLVTGKWRKVLLALFTVLVVALVALVALRGKHLSPQASALAQVAAVLLSIYGGVVFTSEGNDRHVRAAARASVRRVLVTYQSLGRLSEVIAALPRQARRGP